MDEHDDETRFTREELYDLVWARPLRTVAEDFGLSDVGLAKICKKLRVPRPTRGYWAQMEVGTAPARPRLGPASPSTPLDVVIRRTVATVKAPAATPPRVRVSNAPRDRHPAIAAMKRVLEARKPVRNEMYVLPGGSAGAVLRVSPKLVARALRILDALAHALVARGHTLAFEEPQKTYGKFKFEVQRGAEAIDLVLHEKLDQSKHVRTADELRQQKQWGSSFAPKFDYEASGRLHLKLHGPWKTLSRSNWADGANQRVEDVLGKVVLVIEDGFRNIATMRAAEEVERQAAQARAVQRALEKARLEHEQALARDLSEMAASWVEADRMRAFLDAVDARTSGDARAPGFVAWLEWARGCAAQLDPLSRPGQIAKSLAPTPEDPRKGPH